jgi:hypothetical protein
MAWISQKSICSFPAFGTATLSLEIGFRHDSYNLRAFQLLLSAGRFDLTGKVLALSKL